MLLRMSRTRLHEPSNLRGGVSSWYYKILSMLQLKILIIVPVFPFLFCSACNAQGNSKDIVDMAIQVSQVPGVDLDVAAEIPAMDFAVDNKESLHVVWAETFSSNERPSLNNNKIVYIRGDAGGTTWAPPISLTNSGVADNGLRILIGPDLLHVLFGKKLRHFVSGDWGQSWRELAPLISNDEMRADVFDAAIDDESLVVSYLIHPQPDYDVNKRSSKDDQKLYVVRWTPAGVTPPSLIAIFPSSIFGPPMARLAVEGSRLHLMCGLNTERREGSAVGVSGKLFYLRSEDRGVTWSLPVEASLGASKGETSSRKAELQSLGSIELLPTQAGLYAFYRETLLFMTHSLDGSDWSPAIKISPQQSSVISASLASNSASSTVACDRGRLVWIDAHFRRTDRRWWNPLGGVPWSDDNPDWVNNDILTIPLSDLSESANKAQVKLNRDATRLTEPLSYARVVRARASRSRFFILWSGRRKVGKRLDTFGQKPELFYTALPLQ